MSIFSVALPAEKQPNLPVTYPLTIFSPSVGAPSETFIRRHMRELLPGGTVVLTNNLDARYAGHWSVECPILVLNQTGRAGFREAARSVARKLGWQLADRLEIAKRFLQEHRVQVLFGEYLDASLPWLDLAKKLRIRFFAHAHGYDVSRRLRDPAWQTGYTRYNQASGIITMSKASRERLLALDLDPAKIHVVPYGVDVPPAPLTRPHRETLRCLAVGRMTGKKAPVLVLDAFRRAMETRPGLRLDYVGDGELLSSALQFVRAFNLGDRVTLHRAQPNEAVHELMKESDIFLQHSMIDPVTGDEEGLPVAILEAMAHSLPVVSTRHGGIPEAVADGCTGYLVDEGNSVGMAEHILTLARDPDRRRRMGEAGWRRAKEHFSWERERADLLRILGLA